jgi:PPOX class probable F420-dependent enzyme
MPTLSAAELELLTGARRAVLATIADDGSPRLVPMTFVYEDGIVYSAIDEKPKRSADPRDLARVHDIEVRPRVSVLVDCWSEDWSELAWLRLSGTARLIGPNGESAAEHERAVGLLRAKYAQYATHALETRPVIRIEIDRARSWFARAPYGRVPTPRRAGRARPARLSRMT